MTDEGDEENPKPVTVRHLIMVDPEKIHETLESVKTHYPFFGALLTGGPESRVTQFVRHNWGYIHQVTGTKCLLVTTVPPEAPGEEIKAFLVNLLGDASKADEVWQRYQLKPAQVQDDGLALADQLRIDPNKLPCLALMTNLDAKQVLIQRLPDWDEQALSQFFQELFSKVNHHVSESDPQRRLDALKRDLGWDFMAGLHTKYVAGRIGGMLAKVEWSEVITSTLTNKDLMVGAFKVLLGIFGVSTGG
jgi:hypothetical protein